VTPTSKFLLFHNIAQVFFAMHPFQRNEYEPLPAEEKQAVDQEVTPLHAKSSRWSKKSMALIIALVSLFSILAVITTTNIWTPPTAEESVENSEEFHDYLARANGDQYLLGVGKGDITGSVTYSSLNHETFILTEISDLS
jgi:hypothetical protein